MAKRDDLFKVGEVWQSPRGTLYKVMAVDGTQATLRLGSFGDGRIVRRWIYQNHGWKLWAEAQEKAL
ncbi:hypothetical protein LG59_2288 [Serratia ureilytica]|uniref:hypothetical protein n=1 Tax=Serratia ureilytica TaxID=300181 RepID=UPI0006280F2F|nr:hypothetical protein [Serratia ureilytica]KKO59277.1 hypothetical protein LG59_2288 [Serratia ureilytica]